MYINNQTQKTHKIEVFLTNIIFSMGEFWSVLDISINTKMQTLHAALAYAIDILSTADNK